MYWNITEYLLIWTSFWLTLTWDVLKLVALSFTAAGYRINFNMGCIETIEKSEGLKTYDD